MKRAIITKTFYIISSLSILFTFYSCAAIAPPSGGPNDDTPPKFLSSVPESGTTQFKGGTVVLRFSEYIEKKSINSAITVSPKLESPINLVYEDDEVHLQFPKKLLTDQTYIITINRNLTDERNVALDQSIQIAYSTGRTIEDGKIKGRVHGDEKYAVHLWKINDNPIDTFFNSKPLYVSEANDEGLFSFNFLSSGRYTALAVEKSAAGLKLNTERMAYGIGPQIVYELPSNGIIKDIPFLVKRDLPEIKLTHVDWKGSRWGWMHFNRPLNDSLLEEIKIINRDSTILMPNYFQDSKDKSKFLLTLNDTMIDERVDLLIEKITPYNGKSILNSKVSFRASSETDSSYLYLEGPPLSTTVNKDNMGGPLVSLVFSKPIESFSDSAFQLVFDSDTMLAEMNQVNPLEFTFIPQKGWKEKTSYRLLLVSKHLLPIEGKSFPEAVKAIDIISKKKIGYGVLTGSFESTVKPLIAQLKLISKEPKFFISDVNSNNEFYMNELPEGRYELMVVNDSNGDKVFNYGSFNPTERSEWFFVSPDTFDVRANWEIDIGKIKIEK